MNPFKRVPLLPTLIALVLIFLVTITAVLAISDAIYDLSWWTVNGGGGSTSGGKYSVSGTAGQYDAGDLSGGKYDLNGGYWAIDGDKFTYIPVVLANFCGGFAGPREWEGNTPATSPSNNSAVDANGPLCFFRTYIGGPDDDHPELERDWFYFNSDGGPFTVSVRNFLENGAQVLLYYQKSDNRIAFISNQASGNYIINHSGPPGKYLVLVGAVPGHPKGNGDYTLKVTTP